MELRDILFSVITPSCGRRPRSLRLAAASLEEAVRHAGLPPDRVEWLVGFDGVRGERPETSLPARFVDFPKAGEFGNVIRNRLLRLARGHHILLLDDDNAYVPEALALFLPHLEHEMLIGRVDVSRAFDINIIPVPGELPEKAVRQGNIDPLCLCLSRELMDTRCGGWIDEGGYESDYHNIRRYNRRARSVLLLDAVVGIYDAGAGLDPEGLNFRQKHRRGQQPCTS